MSITLELSDEVTQQAKQYARQQGRSLADYAARCSAHRSTRSR
ncbi:hypothetical protein ACFP2F_22190 [Hymenobacter artigasi]|uniref:Antitoxin n=1 Tax=Hymenobacter artigasi TaxID=2719616 RepID=A0ABX1HIE1_9BACT|nr:hypothetical protein [Hymenobacter artigasi]NKI90039.1 hypothetical protein [Hymenobacter artigasi]